MSRCLRIVMVVAVLGLSGGLVISGVRAQQPHFHPRSHPYLAMAHSSGLPWQVHRPAARFHYNPYVPSYVPRARPFSDIDAFRRYSPSRGYSFDAGRYLLDELADEYRYYGFEDAAADLAYR